MTFTTSGLLAAGTRITGTVREPKTQRAREASETEFEVIGILSKFSDTEGNEDRMLRDGRFKLGQIPKLGADVSPAVICSMGNASLR